MHNKNLAEQNRGLPIAAFVAHLALLLTADVAFRKQWSSSKADQLLRDQQAPSSAAWVGRQMHGTSLALITGTELLREAIYQPTLVTFQVGILANLIAGKVRVP